MFPIKPFISIFVTAMLCLISCQNIIAQDFKSYNFTIPLKKTVKPDAKTPDFDTEIRSLEAPSPDGNSYRSFLLRQKKLSKEYYKTKSFQLKKSSKATLKNNALEPIIGLTFEPKRYVANVGYSPIYGGIPSDNTLAISNNGNALLGMNSNLYAHDVVKDTALLSGFQVLSLRAFINGPASVSYYDPKVYYDPSLDRFICVFLKGHSPTDSEIIVCFSSTSDPNDSWFIYNLPGNPLNNNRWTDFPAIAITNDKLYITANLIIPNVSWQIGFDGSIIWELDKNLGFSGATNINSTLYSDIKHNNTFIRNLHPVQGAEGIADELTLLSNRNFDITNDTIFFLRLNNGNLDIQALQTDVNYGVPPNARQFDTDTSDATNGLQTNDARVLGAIKFDDQIQFVSNTINPVTNLSAIYHGTIDISNEEPSVSGKIITSDTLDFGYPNIAWSGNEVCDREVIIAFNYSSFNDFPGVASVYYSNEKEYSTLKIIKEGYNYVNRLSGGYERWGDYFGLQRKYNEGNKVYSFGYLAMPNGLNSGYFAELISPDTSKMHLNFSINSPINMCNNNLKLHVNTTKEPYNIDWKISSSTGISSGNSVLNLCSGDSVTARVKDARGCEEELTFVVPKATLQDGINLYPNPTTDMAALQFKLDEEKKVRIALYDKAGRLVKILAERIVKQGLNEVTFSLSPLSAGQYTVVLFENDIKTQSFKVIKSN